MKDQKLSRIIYTLINANTEANAPEILSLRITSELAIMGSN